MSARVVVAHAGRQYSHQLAQALHARGVLQAYWTGLPMIRPAVYGRAAYAEVELPNDRVRVLPLGTVGHFLERRLWWRGEESVLGQLGDYATDAVYARWLSAAQPTAVIGYENAALATFTAARARGIRTILDAASVHHAAADRWMGLPQPRGWPRDVRAHKDAELRVADHVLVLSALARDTYLAAGVPPARISVVPLGYEPTLFRVGGDVKVGRPMRFVFVGNAGYRKGLDILLDALRRLGTDVAGLRLAVIGDIGGESAPSVERRGKLRQEAIATELASADCLVLPSRCDSFGMVVAEALGAGLPSIVSEHVGAKDLVIQARAGWVVPAGDAEALAARLRWCIDQPQALLEAKQNARAAAGAWTWEQYRGRVADTVLGLLASEAPAHE